LLVESFPCQCQLRQYRRKCSAPGKGGLIRYYTVNRWDDEDEFDEFGKSSVALSSEAETIIGLTNSQLKYCRSTDAVLGEFLEGKCFWVDG
jgi:hypothetical protein